MLFRMIAAVVRVFLGCFFYAQNQSRIFCAIQGDNTMNPIKNLGILAHVDAGKTTITERLLYESGVIPLPGRVDNGTTVTDSMEIEKKRGITIRSSTTSFYWKDTKINIIDTPGHMDFASEVERSFSILDGALLVISAKEGIQSQTRAIFQILKKFNIPTILFINKIDRVGVDFANLYQQISSLLTENIIIMQTVETLPDGQNNLIINSFIHFDLQEKIIELDDILLEKYANNIEIHESEFEKALIRLTQQGKCFPVFHGTALQGIGIHQLLEAIIDYLPVAPQFPSEKLSAFVYKIDRNDALVKRIYLKICSGILLLRQTIEIVNREDEPLKIKQLQMLENAGLVNTSMVHCGDIAVLSNTPNLSIGDVLGSITENIPVFSMERASFQIMVTAVNLEQKNDLVRAFHDLAEEDPALHCNIQYDTKAVIIDVLGKIQLEVIESLLLERYHIPVILGSLSIIYKERPIQPADAVFHIGVSPNFYRASIQLMIEPLPLGSGLVYETKVPYGELSASFQTAVREGVEFGCRRGFYGWVLTDLKVSFVYSYYDSVTSTPSDFRHLAPLVLEQAIIKSGTSLLEPYCNFILNVPNEFISRSISDIHIMKGTTEIIKHGYCETSVTGRIPLDTSKEYSNEVISYTKGRGMFYLKPSDYDFYDGLPVYSVKQLPYEENKIRLMFLKKMKESDN